MDRAPHVLLEALTFDEELKKYKLVDTDGHAFADAALSEREHNRQLGANNFWLAPHFIKRLGQLGWGFGPSITALGLACAFDHDNSPVSAHRSYSSVLEAFPRVSKILFQELNMPDDSWNRKGLAIPLRRAVDIFIPNVNSIDMDTTGTWPFGRLTWEIDRKLQQDVIRPILYHMRQATCWRPEVKDIRLQVNSIYNGWRMEDVWLVR
jgi:hypothetical protein